jgi:hypothetical protein
MYSTDTDFVSGADNLILFQVQTNNLSDFVSGADKHLPTSLYLYANAFSNCLEFHHYFWLGNGMSHAPKKRQEMTMTL